MPSTNTFDAINMRSSYGKLIPGPALAALGRGGIASQRGNRGQPGTKHVQNPAHRARKECMHRRGGLETVRRRVHWATTLIARAVT
jgi:hypothetical protein